MIWYLLSFVVSIIFARLARTCRGRVLKCVYMALSILPPIIVSAIRYDVGNDYLHRYAPDFYNISQGYDVPNLEIGVKFIMRICAIFTDDYLMFFAVTSLMINVLIYRGIYKNIKRPEYGVAAYYVCGYFFLSMNFVRQFLAIAIVASFVDLLINGKRIKFLILILIASSIHISALLYLALFFIPNNRRVKPLLVVIGAIIAAFFIPNLAMHIYNEFGNVMPDNMLKILAYLISEDKGDIPVILIASELIIYICLYNSRILTKMKDERWGYLLINCQLLSLVFIMLSPINSEFIRVSYLFSFMNIYSLSSLHLNTTTRTKRHMLENTARLSVGAIMVVGSIGARFAWDYVYNNEIYVFPYKTVYSRPLNIYEEISENMLQNRKDVIRNEN